MEKLTNMEKLIKDYEGRLKNVKLHLEGYNERESKINLETKESCYVEFISQLKRVKKLDLPHVIKSVCSCENANKIPTVNERCHYCYKERK